MMNEANEPQPAKPRRRMRGCLLILGGLLLAPFVVYGLASLLASHHHLPAELAAPPAPIQANPAGDEATSATTGTATTRPVLVMPQSLDDYLQARQAQAPVLGKVVGLYEALYRRYQAEKIQDGFITVVNAATNYKFGQEPLPPELAAWLLAHVDFFEQALRFAECDPLLPLPGREERIAWASQTGAGLDSDPYGPQQTFVYQLGRMLALEAQRRLEAGDPASAETAIRAALRLSLTMHGGAQLIDHLLAIAQTSQASGVLGAWVTRPDIRQSPAARTLALLDELQRRYPARATGVYALENAYLISRAQYVHAAQGNNWRLPAFGWVRMEERYGPALTEIGGGKLPWLKIPNPAYIATSCIAIYNKQNAPQNLVEYDATWRTVLETCQSGYPALQGKTVDPFEPFSRMSRFNSFRFAVPNYLESQVRTLVAESKLNLVRAGLRLRWEPATALPAGVMASVGATVTTGAPPLNEFDPWRDPFAEQPLRQERDDTGTRLWSLGPDLKDQRGQLAYDPSNGTVSAGDVAIEVAPLIKPR